MVYARPCPSKIPKLLARIRAICREGPPLPGTTSVGALDTLLGKLAFVAGAYRPLRVFMHDVYQARHAAGPPTAPPHTPVELSSSLRTALGVIADHLRANRELFWFRRDNTPGHHLSHPDSVTLLTDSSSTGYGYATLRSTGYGLWQSPQLHAAIHVKELAAAILGLLANAPLVRGTTVQVWTDNQAVAHTLNTYKPHRTTVALLRLLLAVQLHLDTRVVAGYIPTKLNTTADWLSRFTYAAQHADLSIRRSLF